MTKLMCEIWEIALSSDNPGKMFNSFFDTYLKNFDSSFPSKIPAAVI